jgi:hypothetical protein
MESLANTELRPMRRYYFEIRGCNFINYIWAQSFTEAKAAAAEFWMPWWNQIEWLNIDD